MKLKKIFLALAGVLLLAPEALAETSVIEYNYTQGSDLQYYGSGKKENYDVAICIDDVSMTGNKLTRIEIPVLESEDLGNYRIWVSTELKLEKNINVADVLSVEAVPENGKISYTLPEAYTIGGKLYVGYSFDVLNLTDDTRKPVAVAFKPNDNGLWLHSNRSWMSWLNQSSSWGASAAISAFIEGDFVADSFGILSMAAPSIKLGDAVALNLSVVNRGILPVENADYTYSVGSVKGEGHVDFPEPLKSDYSSGQPVTIELPKSEEVGLFDVEIEFTKVNGKANQAPDAKGACTVRVLITNPYHKSLIEEFTGTWCGNCVRGYAAMEYIEDYYSDKIVSIVYHNGDPMAIGINAPDGRYPGSLIDHVTSIYPSYGPGDTEFLDLALASAEEFCPVDVQVSGRWNGENPDVIDATAEVIWVDAPEQPAEDYRVYMVLLADGLRGDANSSWGQLNYMINKQELIDAPGMDRFVNGTAKMDLVYNNVAILTNGYNSEEGTLAANTVNEKQSYSYSFDISGAVNNDGEIIWQRRESLKVAAVLMHNDGTSVKAVNAVVSKVPAPTGVESLAGEVTETGTVCYDVNGCRVDPASSRGLLIEVTTLSDGTRKTRKVMR